MSRLHFLLMPVLCATFMGVGCTKRVIPEKAKENAGYCAQYIQKGKLNQAANRCKQAIEVEPAYAVPYNLMGIIERLRGRSQKAIALFKRAIALDSRLAEAHNNLGGELYEQGKYPPASQSFQRAVAIDPSYLDAHRNLATCSIAMGNSKQAREQFNKCLELSPKDCDCRMGLGKVAIQGNEYDEARSHMQKLVQMCPNKASGWAHLGLVELKTGRCMQSVNAYMSALALDKDHLEARHSLVQAYECVAMNNKSIKQQVEEVKKNPGYAEGHFQLGLALMKQKLFEQALNEFLNTIKLDKTHQLAHYNAAIVFDSLLRKDDTITYCKQFVSMLKPGQHDKEKAWCTQRVKALEFE